MITTAQDIGELPGPADAAALMDQLLGHVRIQILHGVAALHVADHLATGARTAQEVAEREGTQPRATYRLMRAAASLGVLSYEGNRRFGLTGRGHLLRTGVPGSLRSFVLMLSGHWQRQCMGLLPDAVRQGTSQARAALGADSFDYLAQPEHAEEAGQFGEAI